MESQSKSDNHALATRDAWVKALKEGEVMVLKQVGRVARTGNSVLRSIPEINAPEAFFKRGSCNIASSLVEIFGPTDEPLHFHSSHLVGLVVAGEGYFRYR